MPWSSTGSLSETGREVSYGAWKVAPKTGRRFLSRKWRHQVQEAEAATDSLDTGG